MENDGTFQCGRCKTALNETDSNCWRCGHTKLTDMRPLHVIFTTDASALIADQQSIEDMLRVWNQQLTGTSSTTLGPITWTITT